MVDKLVNGLVEKVVKKLPDKVKQEDKVLENGWWKEL